MSDDKFEKALWGLLALVSVAVFVFAVYMLFIYAPAHNCYLRGVPPFGFLECP